MIFPLPARSSIKPAPAGVQALTMNSLRSAWTPVLARLKPPNKQAKENSELYIHQLYSLSDWYKISVRPVLSNPPFSSASLTALLGLGNGTFRPAGKNSFSGVAFNANLGR